MKSKTYWNKVGERDSPFELPKQISQGIRSAATRLSELEGQTKHIRYIWIYVTEEGIQKRFATRDSDSSLKLNEWLNTIDESASLGAEWMVIYAGASLSDCPEIWTLCQWAQTVHKLKIGIHLDNVRLSDEDVLRLTRLDASRVFLLVDKSCIEKLRYLEEKGICICESNIRPDERHVPCTNPKAMACVGVDGNLYTCGLVLNDERYALGNIRERSLREIMTDESLPHEVPDTPEMADAVGGCDACPSHMEERVTHRFAELASKR